MKAWTDLKRNPHNIMIGTPKIGKDCWIGFFTVLDASGGLTIGDRTIISSGVHIYTHENRSRHEVERSPVTIGDGCYIGANAVIMMGCTIGDSAVVGAGAVVTKGTYIKVGETWVGCPAKRVK